MQKLIRTTSFLQDQKHDTKSDRFCHVTPSDIEQVMSRHGFDLVHLRSGNARKVENTDHQTTIARYRSPDGLKIDGLDLDIVLKVPHLYGSVQAFLGTYRQICTNGLAVGTKQFEMPRIRHSSGAVEKIDTHITELVAKHESLRNDILGLSSVKVTDDNLVNFVNAAVKLRLGDSLKNVVNINPMDLYRPRRTADRELDAFTVFNVVQENLMRYGFTYTIKNTKGLRQQTARPLLKNVQGNELETNNSVDVNRELWNLTRLLVA